MSPIDPTRGTNASAVKPIRIAMPEPQFQPIVSSDRETSSPDEQDGAIEIAEEDARSVIGVSIGKEQTRLKSPQTPSAEKAAAMTSLEGGGLFDGALDEHEEVRDISNGNDVATPPEHNNLSGDTDLPSPWQATSRPLETIGTEQESDQWTSPTSMVPDLNVRRYLNNFILPSMPKTPSFKDFSVPSLGSILSNARSRSPLRKDSVRSKRASTYTPPASSNIINSGPFEQRLFQPRNPRRQRDLEDFELPQKTKTPRPRPSAEDEDRLAATRHRRSISDVSPTRSHKHSLRRATSDQSLLLRRATSTRSSLGDDTRWENVQDQVNSRMKAIKDSLQDSSIKLPSMPNLSGLSLAAFRPDFTRSRAASDPKLPADGRNHGAGSANGHQEASGRQLVTNVNCRQGNDNGPKPVQSYFDEALENLSGDLVILGGYRGSILRSAKPPHRQLWVPVKVGLNIRKVNLEIGLQPEDEENMKDHIFASGMLSHIGPVDMGRRLLKRLRTCKNVQDGRLHIHDYGYDWRLSPHLLSDRFLAFLRGLRCNRAEVSKHRRGAIVIAHSMGGIITRHAVNRTPELFAGVVYAGVPQHCVNILGPLRNGDDVLLSSKVLTAQVNFTLRSSYLLLPENGKCFINKETKEEYPVNFFSVDDWRKYAWSPCVAPALPATNASETKGLLGSMTEMLPSMPSLPFSSKKQSPQDITTSITHTTDAASTKIDEIADPATVRALDPQLSSPAFTLHGNSQQSSIPLPDALAYLKRTLDATLAFKAELTSKPDLITGNVYPPLSILYANNTPTVAAARVSSREAIKHADAYDDLQFGSGDGVCLARAAMLPEGYTCVKGGKVRTERGHVGLLGDLEAVGKCLLAVMDGRGQGIGLGDQKSY
ncbi:hypothetical protein MMC21_004982 [Puttea exsequens]|nr:hypothetical protein [Puttea exsequens]